MRNSFNVITFSFKDVEHVIDDRMGPSKKEVAALLAEIAEHFKDDDLKKRGWFINKLREVGFEGIKLISVEEVNMEKKELNEAP